MLCTWNYHNIANWLNSHIKKLKKKNTRVRFTENMSNTENHLDKDMATRKQKIHLGSINLYVLQGYIFGDLVSTLIETRYFVKIK